MIKAEEARAIVRDVEARDRERKKKMIETEARSVCGAVRTAAERGKRTCDVSLGGYGNVAELLTYLRSELGFSVRYDSRNDVLSVGW